MVVVTSYKLVACFMVGTLLILLGGVLAILMNEIIPRQILKEVTLKKDSKIYNDWVENTVATYYKVWVFDIQNEDEVLKKGDKPSLQERGPYTYKEYRKKYNITYHDNRTVSYRELQYYVFDDEASIGLESDVITTANVVMMTIANLIKYEYPFIKELTDLILDAADDNKLLNKYTISQLLWGYDDPLLSKVNGILTRFGQKPIDPKIGLFYGKNNSNDGLYTVYTEKARLGDISNWNGVSEMAYWTTDSCRMINGTEGRFFHPDVKTKDTLYVFSSDLFRSFYLTYLWTTKVKDIELYSFVIPDQAFAVIPENQGFCTPVYSCTPAGVLNITMYKNNAPIYMSQPHFYAGDPHLVESVNGLHPTPIEHQTILDVEPITGIVMNVNKRLQINVLLQNVSNIRESAPFRKRLYLPMAWLNESASLDEASANKFKKEILQPMKLANGLVYAVVITGAVVAGIIMLFSISRFIFTAVKERKDVNDDVYTEKTHLVKTRNRLTQNDQHP